MAGVSIELDNHIKRRVREELIAHGIINDECEMTHKEAEDILFTELEKGRKSGTSPRSHEEIFSKLYARCHASQI